MDDFAAMARLIEALRPWLGHLVIAGGWAHRLHRYHELAHTPAYAALRTKDADVAFSPAAPIEGNIAAALRAAGFEEAASGEHSPPITQYRLGAEGGGFYTEFLVPLQGGEVKRGGRADVTLAMAGVTAQKLLIRGLRRRDKQAQDVLYVHDTLELFAGELPRLRALWSDRSAQRCRGAPPDRSNGGSRSSTQRWTTRSGAPQGSLRTGRSIRSACRRPASTGSRRSSEPDLTPGFRRRTPTPLRDSRAPFPRRPSRHAARPG